MRIAKRSIRHEQARLPVRPFGEFLRTKAIEELARTFRPLDAVRFRNRRRAGGKRLRPPCHSRVSVDDDVSQIGQQFGRAIAARFEAEQFRRLVEKGSGYGAGLKFWMVDNVFKKWNIRFDSTDAEFAERAIHALAGLLETRSPGGDLH